MSVRTLALCSLLLVGVHAGGVGNEAPLADAGLDQEGRVGSTVYLDGTGSTDPDGDSLSYEWAVIREDGTEISLSCVDCPRPTFVPPSEGTYRVRLEVTDSEGASDTDVLYVGAQPVSTPATESETATEPASSTVAVAPPQGNSEPSQPTPTPTTTPTEPTERFQFSTVPDRSAAPQFEGLCYYDGSCETSEIPGGTDEYNVTFDAGEPASEETNSVVPDLGFESAAQIAEGGVPVAEFAAGFLS